MNKLAYAALSSIVLLALQGCNSATKEQTTDNKVSADQTENNLSIWPVINSEVKTDVALERQVQAMLATMTLEQKVAQMIQPEIRDITPEDMRKYGFWLILKRWWCIPAK